MSSTSVATPRKTSDQQCCCLTKQYYSKLSALSNSLSIIPRLIIIKKSLKLNETYRQNVSITNTGLYPRHLKYYTNSEADTELKVFGTVRYRYINPGQNIHLEVTIKPISRQELSIDRHIYIESEHPNIIFDIPLIRDNDDPDLQPALPSQIIFPRSLPNSKSFYELIVYNPSRTPTAVVFKSVSTRLNGKADPQKARPRDFSKVVLTLEVKDMQQVMDSFKIKFGERTYFNIAYVHLPTETSLYLNVNYLHFEETKYEREVRKSFSICNECDRPIRYKLSFLTEESNRSAQAEKDHDHDLYAISETSLSNQSVQDGTEVKLISASEENHDEKVYRHFRLDSKMGTIKPFSFERFNIVFHPVMDPVCDFDDNLNPPYLIMSKLFLESPDDEFFEKKTLVLSGLIGGVEVNIAPKIIDFRKVFIGEEHCEQIRVVNTDGVVNSKVFFKHYSDKEQASVVIGPIEGHEIEPCERKLFNVTFFSKVLGKLVVRLIFKVRNGPELKVIIKAHSQAVRVRTYPDLIEFGSVPVAVPQKRTVLVANPLSVPISLRFYVSEDGSEPPLILSVENAGELPPITMRNPYDDFLEVRKELYSGGNDEAECNEIISLEDSLPSSYRSYDISDNTSFSSKFANEVLDPISSIAGGLVHQIKHRRYDEKPDADLNIISEATYALLDISYFERLIRYTNYAYIDWNALPSDPRELYVDTEVIHLKPNTVKNVTILIVPNHLGYFNRSINVRCFPHADHLEKDDPLRTIVDTKLMVTQIWIEYNCRMPEISWNSEIRLQSTKPIYVFEDQEFEMEFENDSNIGGFFHYAIVPDSDVASMRFIQDVWKFYIKAQQIINVPCAVQFKKIGDVEVSGLIKFVGNVVGAPFHIKAHVLPTRVRVTPKKVYQRIKILEKPWVYIFIENLTPTSTFFILRLKNESHQYEMNPRGFRLAPTGQAMYVAIRTFFRDPEVYKNILFIHLQYGKVIEVPITFNVIGVPIFFDPEIRNGLNAGIMLANCQRNLQGGLTQYSKIIRAWNLGERTYTITFNKTKSSEKHCAIEEVKGGIRLSPKNFELGPGDETELHLLAFACDEIEVYNEFRVDITDKISKKRMETIRFVVTAKFMSAQLHWSRKEICMDYYRTHPFNEFPQLEIVKLINETELPIDIVHLQVFGPFKIKEYFENKLKRELMFSMRPAEIKELTVALDKDALLADMYCTKLKGRVVCHANSKQQKTLLLNVNVTYPRIIILNPSVVLFTSIEESDTIVEIENVGRVDAQFKWRKISEKSEYFSDVDDETAYAHDLISDIIRMLDIADADWPDDPLCEDNLQKCYEKYHCYLKRLEDPIGIREIVCEIIENIDYEHKRYHLILTEADDVSIDDSKSSVVAAKTTIHQIIDKLVLEDVYEISEPSSEDCDKTRTVYFYEKAGRVNAFEKLKVALHLPGVRKDYTVKASFILDVVGGERQQFSITLINQRNVIRLSTQSVYLGAKPWYELYKANVSIENLTKFTVDVKVEQTTKLNNTSNKIADGYVRILNEHFFHISKLSSTLLRAEGILGFARIFVRNIKLTINEHETKHICLRGQGVMPMLGVIDELPRQEQNEFEIENEYKLLQRIYYFEIFKIYTEEEEDICEGLIEEEMCKASNPLSYHSQLSSSNLTQISKTTQQTQGSQEIFDSENEEEYLWDVTRNYVFVEHMDVPNRIVLEQSLQTERFLQLLTADPYTAHLLHLIYCDYLKFLKTYDEKLPMNLKYFTVQPLPFEQLGYIFKMEGLKMNQFRKFEINLHFYGPGTLIACARTTLKIPGFIVDFKVHRSPSHEIEFLHYNAETKAPDFSFKKYRNIHERLMDLETVPRIKHPHAFDCKNLECGVHKRDIKTVTAKERKNLQDYYSSLNKSVHSDHKHHFVLSKIFSKSKYNFTDMNMQLTILVKPTSDFYEIGQMIEDFLYIDLHMGPTLPILMRGLIS